LNDDTLRIVIPWVLLFAAGCVAEKVDRDTAETRSAVLTTQSEELLNPRAISWGPGRIDLFAVGASTRTLYHKVWTGLLDSSDPWEVVGGDIADAPAIVSSGPNHLDVFVISTDQAMYHKAWDSTNGWQPADPSSWDPLGGSFTGAPAAAAQASLPRIDVFAVGTDAAVHHIIKSAAGWSSWESLGGQALGSPAAVSWGPTRVDVFFTGQQDHIVYHKWSDDVGWFPSSAPTGWEGLGGWAAGSPSASSWGTGRIDVAFVATDGTVRHRALNQMSWSPITNWDNLGGHAVGTAIASSWGSQRFDVTVIGADDGAVYHKAWDPTSTWQPAGMSGPWDRLAGRAFGMPTVPSFSLTGSWGPNRYDVFVTGSDDGAVYHKFWTPTLGGWVPGLNTDNWDRQASPPPFTPARASYLVLACKFADHPETWTSLDYIGRLFTSAGSGENNFVDYWSQISEGAIDLSGSTVTSAWATMPNTFASYYGASFCMANAPWPGNQMVQDCITASGYQNSLGNYYGVIAVVNYGQLFQGGKTVRDTGTGPRPFGQVILGPGVVPCNNGPPYTPANYPPMDGTQSGHEMGHSLGLSHAHAQDWNGTYDEYGDGWDIMGGNQQGFSSSNFVKVGPGIDAPHRHQLGWIEPSRLYTYLGGGAQQIQLTAINHPENSGYRMARVLFGEDAQHDYTVELRTPTDWDQGLGNPPPSQAVVIHEVRYGTESVLRLKDSTHGQFEPGDAFTENGVTIHVDSFVNASTPSLLQAYVTITRN
jgi:hypothetical protein